MRTLISPRVSLGAEHLHGLILHPLFALLTSVTRQDLARQVAYLQAENRILRSRLPKRLTVTPQEKRTLLRSGRRLGMQLKSLILIVTYSRFRRWIQEAETQHTNRSVARHKPGRPRTSAEIEQLVLRLARENALGLHPHPRRAAKTRDHADLPTNGEEDPESPSDRSRPGPRPRELGRIPAHACRHTLAVRLRDLTNVNDAGAGRPVLSRGAAPGDAARGHLPQKL